MSDEMIHLEDGLGDCACLLLVGACVAVWENNWGCWACIRRITYMDIDTGTWV